MKKFIALSVLCIGSAFCMDDSNPRARSQSSPAAIDIDKPLTQDQQEMLKAVRCGDYETLKKYASGKQIEAFNYGFGRSLLHIAFSDLNKLNVAIVTFLVVDCKFNVNATDKYGKTPLHCLIEGWHFCNDSDAIKCAEILLAHGANINAKTKANSTPLDAACSRCAKAIQFLLKHEGTASEYSQESIGKAMIHLLKSTCQTKLGNIQDNVDQLGHVKFGSTTIISTLKKDDTK